MESVSRLASLLLILSMLTFVLGRVLRITPWAEVGTHISVGAWVTMMLALPVAIPGLISKDPALMGIYAVAGGGTLLWAGIKLRERLRR